MPEETTQPGEPALKNGTGTFGDALLALKAGKKVARKGWTHPIHLAGLDFVFDDPDQKYYPVVRDILAEDWFMVE